MSGPKCSKIDLTEAERRRQEAERIKRLKELEEIKKFEKKREESAELRKQLQAMMIEVESIYETDIQEGSQLLDSNYYIEQIKAIKQSIISNIEMNLNKNEDKTLEFLSISCEEYKNLITDSRRLVDKELRQNWEALNLQIRTKNIVGKEEELISKTKSISANSRKVFDLSKCKSKTTDKAEINEQLKEFQNMLKCFLEADNFKYKDEIYELKTSTEFIIGDISLDEAFKKELLKLRFNTFVATKSKYDKALQYIQDLLKEYEEEKVKYEVLCNLLNKSQIIDFISNRYISLEERLQIIKKQNELLIEELRKKEEAEYISSTVNQVMKELGYSIISEDYLTTSNCNVAYNLYEFEDDSAINVLPRIMEV